MGIRSELAYLGGLILALVITITVLIFGIMASHETGKDRIITDNILQIYNTIALLGCVVIASAFATRIIIRCCVSQEVDFNI